jgi:D-alanyl-D-alanine carboxypeptidase
MKTILIAISTLISTFVAGQNTRAMADSIRLKRHIPALMYAVVTTDSMIDIGGVGYKQFKIKDTIALNNRFHLGSATASITTFMAVQLVAQKKITWTTPLLQLLPELSTLCRPEFRTITFGELLSQRAGLLDINTKENFYNLPAFNVGEPVTKQRISFCKWVIQQRATKDSSNKRVYRFSNANTAVAVAMMEKASGKTWEELLILYVNKPLGISIKTDWPIRLSETEPMGHLKESGTAYISLNRHYWFRIIPAFTGACDANITIKDYALFVQDQLRGLTSNEKALLPSKDYALMHNAFMNYGYGWSHFMVNDYHVSECDGTLGSFYSHVEIVREKNIAVIVLCNSGDNDGKGATLNLAKKLREMYAPL